MTTFYNCPLPPEPFVGRQRELDLIMRELPSTPVTLIAGVGGIGKTALALAAAARAAEELDRIPLFVHGQAGWGAGAFLRAVNVELVRLGEESFIPFLNDPVLSLKERVVHLAGLLDRGGFLLLADDGGTIEPRDFRAMMDELMDRLQRGRVIVTSRRRHRIRGASGRAPLEIRLRPLLKPDAARLFALLAPGSPSAPALARAEGHPLYLKLLARGAEGPPFGSGTGDVVSGVFEGLGADEQEALGALCVLRVPLARSDLITLAGPSSAELLDRLEDAFLVERLPQNRWRLPPFVAETLRWRLQAPFAEAQHKKAAGLFENRYLAHKGPLPEVVLEAHHHLVACGDPDRATLLLAQAAPDLEAAGCYREILLLAGATDPEFLARPTDLALRVARALRHVGQTREALKRLRGLESASTPRSPVMAQLWSELGQVNHDMGQGQIALDYYFKALERAREGRDRRLETSLTNKLATVLKDRGEFDRATHLYRQAADLARELDAESEQAWAMHNLGKIHYLRGQLAEARAMAERAQASYEKAKDKLGRALARNVIANIHRDLGDLESAHQIYTENLAMYRSLGSRFGEAFCLSNLGDLMREEGRLQQAVTAYQEAMSLATAIGNRFGEGIYTTRLSEVHRAMGEYERALAFAAQARRVWSEVGNTSGVAWALAVEGEVQRDRGQYALALQALARAQEIRAELKEWGGVAAVLLVQSMILADVGEMARATELAREAQALLARRGGPDDPGQLSSHAYLLLRQGDSAGARQILEELVSQPPTTGGTRERARALGALAQAVLEEGQPKRARQLVDEALHLARARFDRRGEAIALSQGAAVEVADGNLTAASESYREALKLSERLGDLRGEAQAALGLGEVALYLGDAEQAQTLLERAQELSKRGGFPRPGLRAQLMLALLARRGGDAGRATDLAREALERARSLSLRADELFAEGVLGLAGATTGRGVEAAIAELKGSHQNVLANRLERERGRV